MDLRVPYSNISDKKQAFEKAKQLIPQAISQFGIKTETKMDETNNKVSASGKGFSAEIEFTDTEALVNLDLNILLRPLKGKILGTIEEEIKKVV